MALRNVLEQGRALTLFDLPIGHHARDRETTPPHIGSRPRLVEHTFAGHSYGFRPGRGAKDALRRVQQLLNAGKTWVVDAGIKGCFDNMPQDKLLQAVEAHVSDGKVLELLRRFLEQGVMESGKGWRPTETGTPQGAIISPLPANIYLNPLDKAGP